MIFSLAASSCLTNVTVDVVRGFSTRSYVCTCIAACAVLFHVIKFRNYQLTPFFTTKERERQAYSSYMSMSISRRRKVELLAKCIRAYGTLESRDRERAREANTLRARKTKNIVGCRRWRRQRCCCLIVTGTTYSICNAPYYVCVWEKERLNEQEQWALKSKRIELGDHQSSKVRVAEIDRLFKNEWWCRKRNKQYSRAIHGSEVVSRIPRI